MVAWEHLYNLRREKACQEQIRLVPKITEDRTDLAGRMGRFYWLQFWNSGADIRVKSVFHDGEKHCRIRTLFFLCVCVGGCTYGQGPAQPLCTHVAVSSVGMATVGELRWARSHISPSHLPGLAPVRGNLRHKKWWAYCWLTCLFFSFTFPRANQFTLFSASAWQSGWGG